jgi:hypothetical protein
VVFGSVTGLDPRSLRQNGCSGYELGLSRPQVVALEQLAFDQLAASGTVKPMPLKPATPGKPVRCVRGGSATRRKFSCASPQLDPTAAEETNKRTPRLHETPAGHRWKRRRKRRHFFTSPSSRPWQPLVGRAVACAR